MNDKTSKTKQEWQRQPTAEQLQLTRVQGTERVFSGKYHDAKTEGVYTCVCRAAPLFRCAEKYASGSRRPRYWQPVAAQAVRTETDTAHGMRRLEVLWARCDTHLGHVLEDRPKPPGDAIA